jgi:hypothetical protein
VRIADFGIQFEHRGTDFGEQLDHAKLTSVGRDLFTDGARKTLRARGSSTRSTALTEAVITSPSQLLLERFHRQR